MYDTYYKAGNVFSLATMTVDKLFKVCNDAQWFPACLVTFLQEKPQVYFPPGLSNLHEQHSVC